MKNKWVVGFTLAAVTLLVAAGCNTLSTPDTLKDPAPPGATAEAGASQSVTTEPSVPPSPSGVLIPLQDALPDLAPQTVFQNFYDITQIPRPSGQVDQIREFLVQFGDELGLETSVDEAGNVIIRKPAAAGLENRQGVVLQAHMDMVAQGGPEYDPTTDPIQAFVDGDYIVTQGTTLGADDGIGLALAMTILQDTSLQAGPIEALFTVDEETTMSGANELKSGILQGSILINLDNEWEGTFVIGSAGGEHLNVNMPYAQTPAPADLVSYLVKIEGLQGGHSGVDIDKGLGHATKLLVRLLKGAEAPYELRLASLAGGTAGNAIPREATALVFLPPDQVDSFTTYVGDYEATIQTELAETEPDLKVNLEAIQPPAQVMDPEFQSRLLNALYGAPQGVTRMSDTVPGLVETSNNLGVTTIQDGQMELVAYARSSVNSELTDIGQMVGSVWELAGYPVEITDWFGAWTPNPDSPIVELMQSTYQELFGVEPTLSAVHAGLECSTIGSKYPGMDMISIGPSIDKVHSPSERLHIPSVAKALELLTATLAKIPEK